VSWNEQHESPLVVTLKGVAAGLVGTLVMTTALRAVDRLANGADMPADGNSQPTESEPVTGAVAPTERVAERLANRVFGAELSRETRQRLGLGVYWTYGAFWGALSALLQEAFQPSALYHGALLGFGVWLVGPMRLIPALGLYERPASAGIIRRLLAISLHLLYGWTTAWTYRQIASTAPDAIA
jgi:hypothetical protein